MRNRIVVVGDVTADIIASLDRPPVPDDDVRAKIAVAYGGQAANTAAWLAWLGQDVTLVASVGDDPFGSRQLDDLRRQGVRCVGPVGAEATGMVVILSLAGQRTMMSDRGANARLSPADVEAALTPDAGHLHLSGHVLLDEVSRPAGLHALRIAQERGLTTSVDAAAAHHLAREGAENFLAWIRGVDLLLANGDEAVALGATGDLGSAAATLATAVRDVVIKLGSEGAMWAREGSVIMSGPVPTVAVDTTGAGDAFAAGLLSGLVPAQDPAATLGRAVALGAKAASIVGARPCPTDRDLDAVSIPASINSGA